MAIVIIQNKLTKEDLEKALVDLKEYSYLKITIDIHQKILALGGKLHADAEKILLQDYNSKQDDVWGGGYDLKTQELGTSAVLNLRAGKNDSMEILEPKIREKFLDLAKKLVQQIESVLWLNLHSWMQLLI